jgi:serine/threonine-protein kinase SRPK1
VVVEAWRGGVQSIGEMSAKTDVNRRVLAIQAKKKRHKPSKRKGKSNPQGEQDAQSSKGPRSGQVAATDPAFGGTRWYSDDPLQRYYPSDNGTR